ncbi:MAG: hypothetical protein M3Q65_13640, partial [Chloroflexota bacterium]|nr:hypothetical protein [Chloroflexota bacterium]
MILFPLSAALISLACAAIAARRYWARRRPHELCWSIAFGFFALGAAAATAGYLAGWTPLLVRLFYVSGAILTTGFLGLGSLYILAGQRLDRWGAGVMLALTALAFAFVFNTPVDEARLGEAWDALEREGTPTRLLTIITNIAGTLIVVGGALYSIYAGLRRGMPRGRALGLLLIAAGTLIVASGSSLKEAFGNSILLFVPMAPGVLIILLGYLQANRAGRPAPAGTAVAGGGAAT